MKSSSTGSPNLARISAMISACLTVSIPNSPSKSWSNSTKSAGYPVWFTTTSITICVVSPAGTDAGAGVGVGAGIGCSMTGAALA